MTNRPPKLQIQRIGLHVVRVAIFAAILVLIRLNHQSYLSARQTQGQSPPLSVAQSLFTGTHTITPAANQKNIWLVRGRSNEELGLVMQTSPYSDRVVGFSGPTNCLIGLQENQMFGVRILSSQDTQEHVAKVLADSEFWGSFVGTDIDHYSASQIDAVSGATLTSMAIAESVAVRLNRQTTRSLRFPEPIGLTDIQRLFPKAQSYTALSGYAGVWDVESVQRHRIGLVVRISPVADRVIGYQGPSDVLIGFDVGKRFKNLYLRSSFDNQPYVRYITEDPGFEQMFSGMNIEELAEIDLESGDYDGVSGATMTSQAIANGIKMACQDFIQPRASNFEGWSRLSARDYGTIAIVLCAVALSYSRLRGSRVLRLLFQFALIGYLGLTNGDLLSQALLVGWAQNGVPWSHAGGLVVLCFAALVCPILTRRNLYCTHLCPHGAVQEILKDRLPYRIPLSRRIRRWAKRVPVLLLVWCAAVAMLHLPFRLVNIEPFNAWVYYVAGWATIAIAIVGLVSALFVPMAYCKYGCPTGAVLQYLRFNSSSDRWGRADTFACCLVGFVLGAQLLPRSMIGMWSM